MRQDMMLIISKAVIIALGKLINNFSEKNNVQTLITEAKTITVHFIMRNILIIHPFILLALFATLL